MIDGLLLLLELGLMLVLLITVWNAHKQGREDHLGFFAYKTELEPPPGPQDGPPGQPGPTTGGQTGNSRKHPPGGRHHA